jgi:hypothetical protein
MIRSTSSKPASRSRCVCNRVQPIGSSYRSIPSASMSLRRSMSMALNLWYGARWRDRGKPRPEVTGTIFRQRRQRAESICGSPLVSGLPEAGRGKPVANRRSRSACR